MNFKVYSYHYAQEILQHVNFQDAWNEIYKIIHTAPVFIYPNKSSKNRRLRVVQQLMNAYFDRIFAVEHAWLHHPLATGIADSQLRADYRKTFIGRDGRAITVQTEVQFGNMSRWYSDIFKFQTGYSQKLIQLGLSVIPMKSLAVEIDSNVVSFERAMRELPSADLSISLPIVLVGLSIDSQTPICDISECQFADIKAITGKGNAANQQRIVDAYLRGDPMRSVGPSSPTGPDIPLVAEDEENDEDGDS